MNEIIIKKFRERKQEVGELEIIAKKNKKRNECNTSFRRKISNNSDKK